MSKIVRTPVEGTGQVRAAVRMAAADLAGVADWVTAILNRVVDVFDAMAIAARWPWLRSSVPATEVEISSRAWWISVQAFWVAVIVISAALTLLRRASIRRAQWCAAWAR